jgi:hypothetical protein
MPVPQGIHPEADKSDQKLIPENQKWHAIRRVYFLRPLEQPICEEGT